MVTRDARPRMTDGDWIIKQDSAGGRPWAAF
jgi:hypothetical protein